jgi:rare lipoprotein A (peptidoglycan hydrolase)
MILAKPLSLFLTLSFIVVVDLQAQVGEKFYGRASYYADKFHGRSTSSGEIYDRAEYTAAHRDLPFNTIVEVINTTNNRTAVVKINDRGPFAYNRMLDLSFAAAKDLELLGPGEAEIEMRILSMDKSEYTISSFYAGAKGEFNREFNQYQPVAISGKNIVKVTLDTSYVPHNPTALSLQPKPVTEAFVVADSLRRQQAEGDKMGFRQHKYIRVIKDGDGHYRLDSSIVTPPTPQEVYSVAPQSNNFNTYESRPSIVKSQIQKQVVETKVNDTQVVMKSVAEAVQADNRVGGFRQHQYVRIYTDSEGRIRMDTTQKSPVQLVKNTEKQLDKTEDKPQVFNTVLTNSPKITTVANSSKLEATKPKEIYKDGFRQHSYIKVYKDKDGKMKVDTSSFERPK